MYQMDFKKAFDSVSNVKAVSQPSEAGTYNSSFHNMNPALGVLLLPWMVRLPEQLSSTHLYSWVERGTVRVKCLALGPGPLDPESNTLLKGHCPDFSMIWEAQKHI